MPRIVAALLAMAGALSGPALAAPGDTAQAQIHNAAGQSLGTISLTETPRGVLLRGELASLPPGPHGFHVHAVGKCEAPFASAGGHFNPSSRKHGFEVVEGAHAGDLSNLHAGADGKAAVDGMVPGVTLANSGPGLLGPAGTAIVVHAKADDYKTDPAGDSGDRIACGLIKSSK